MAVILPELTYPKDALAPNLSEMTLDCHYGRHHSAYVADVNRVPRY
ncbi:MAG: hypothetical protein V2B18_03125 [Pseudomonadota bacterium]